MFTYRLTSPDGILVEYTTIKRTASDLIKGHDMTVEFFEKNGWQVEKQVTPSLTPKNVGNDYTCSECGAGAEFKEGISAKTNKPWKAVFCKDVKEHVRWIR